MAHKDRNCIRFSILSVYLQYLAPGTIDRQFLVECDCVKGLRLSRDLKWGTGHKQAGKHYEKRRDGSMWQVCRLLTVPVMESNLDQVIETGGGKELFIEKASIFFMANFPTSK